MEKDNFNIKITFGDIARAVGDLAMGVIRHLPESGYPSERGASAMLDRHLYDEVSE